MSTEELTDHQENNQEPEPAVIQVETKQEEKNPYRYSEEDIAVDDIGDENIPPNESGDAEEKDTPPDDPLADEKDSSQETQGDMPEGFNDDLLKRAEAIGFTREEAVDFGKPELLERAVQAVERKLGAQNQEAPEPRVGDDEFDEEAMIKKLEEEYDAPEVAQMFKKMSGKMKQMESAFEQQWIQNFERQFDGMIHGLGDDWEPIYGKGSIRTIDQKSSGAANRAKVVQEMVAINAGRQKAGLPMLSTDELFERAHNSLFGKEREKLLQQKLSRAQEKHQQRFISRPSHRESAPMTAEERAMRFAETEYKKRDSRDEDRL